MVVGSRLGPNGLMLVVISGSVEEVVAVAVAAEADRSQQSMVALLLGKLATRFLQFPFPQK